MTPMERDDYLDQAYKNLFNSAQGIAVLTDILYHLNFFLPASGEGPQACNNVGKTLLWRCGPEIAGAAYKEYFKFAEKETKENG